MANAFSLFVGLRYTRAKKRSKFVSFITLMSVLGIALGVMVLVTVLSVMNGFNQQISQKLFTMVPQITISSPMNKLPNWKSLVKEIKKNPQVTSVIPVAAGQVLISKDGTTVPAVTNGIATTGAGKYTSLNGKMQSGKLSTVSKTPFSIVLGVGLASNLGVLPGDTVNLITPAAVATPVGILPRFRQFKVVGIFKTGSGFGFDDAYAFTSLKSAQSLFMLGKDVTSLQVRINNLFAAPSLSWKIQRQIGDQYVVSNWTNRYGAFYHAIRMEKTIMFFILLLIIAVAAFNLVSGLMMAVNDKSSDIAILRTLGATPATIMRIFIIQGAAVGLLGVLVGAIAGVILSLNVTALVNWIQDVFQVQFLNASVYFVNFLPSQLQWMDVLHVALIAFAMCLLATLYPAWKASKVQPAEALRYE